MGKVIEETPAKRTAAKATTNTSDDRGGIATEVARPSGVASGQQATNISTPVGNDEDGRPVFAQVRFDSSLKKEFVTGLKKYLEYLETTLQ